MNILSAIGKLYSKRLAQFAVVALVAVALKQYYSTASVNQLRWILAPTTSIVQFVSGSSFTFESHAGYINGERTFVIAASCAGVNFLITAFLMLSLRRLWREGNSSWGFILIAAAVAYLSTLLANTVRISTALRMQQMSVDVSWLSGNQLHRLEGIFIYFGFLLLLFLVSENFSCWVQALKAPPRARGPIVEVKACKDWFGNSSLLRQSFYPLVIYYGTTLGIPLVTAAYRQGAPSDFWEHLGFVLIAPLPLLVPIATYRFYRSRSFPHRLGMVTYPAHREHPRTTD